MSRRDYISIFLLLLGLFLFAVVPIYIHFKSIYQFFAVTISGTILIVIGLATVDFRRFMRQSREIKKPKIPKEFRREDILMIRPASMIKFISRFGYLSLTKDSLDFWAMDILSPRIRRILSIPLERIDVHEYKGILRYLYGHMLIVKYMRNDDKRSVKRFSFVRSWGATWSPPGIDADVIRGSRILHDMYHSGSWAARWVEGINEAKRRLDS